MAQDGLPGHGAGYNGFVTLYRTVKALEVVRSCRSGS
jgi:hypothetical protein